jgi:non-heme chloroperoxidase
VPYLTSEDDVFLHYTDEGKGNTIFLIHGWTVNHKFFKDNIIVLAKTHRVVTLDLRGHGHSWSRQRTCNLAQAARDVRRVIEHLDLDDVTIAGWSMGAAVIFNYFDLFGGEKLKGGVYIDMTPCILKVDGWEHALFGSLDWRMAVKLQSDILVDRLTFASKTVSACFKGGKCPDEATLEWGIAESMLTSTEVTLEYWTSLLNQDWRTQLPETPVPVLLTYGAKSAVYPTALGEALHRMIPSSRLVMFNDSGHSPFIEEPERWNAEVVRFAG